ncbi:MAG: hypothetical protein GX410_06100 [Elusimicrobia bacterium]|nr:hypothetical protein [Elusimicrobiota bacterium]
MRSTFFKTFFELADKGANIHLLTADLGFGVLTPYLDKGSQHVTNVGVAEQNMIGLGAGMAMRGVRPYCYSMVPFLLMRTLDQIRADICATKLPVTLVGVGAGLAYGPEGMTHHAIEDIAITRTLPNLTIFSPGDPQECAFAVEESFKINGPVYLRIGANMDPALHPACCGLKTGKLAKMRDGSKAAVIATGTMLARAHAAVDALAKEGIECALYSAHTLKPLDKNGIAEISLKHKLILSVEEHSLINGLGSAVADILLEAGYKGRFLKIGLPDEYASRLGTRDWLRDHYGLSAGHIGATLKDALKH